MKLVYVEESNNVKKKILGIHSEPEKLPDEVVATGILVENDAVPEVPAPQESKDIVPYIYTDTNTVIFEYEDRPLTDKERIVQLEKQNADFAIALARVLGM
jgi:hypothetical protein